jgi:hypothetical protein
VVVVGVVGAPDENLIEYGWRFVSFYSGQHFRGGFEVQVGGFLMKVVESKHVHVTGAGYEFSI